MGRTDILANVLGALLVAGSAGCAGESGHGPYPAHLPDAPQVESFGGPVLKAPLLVPVFFAGDDAAIVQAIGDFSAHVGASGYWRAATSEYGVGQATSVAPIVLAEAAPAAILMADVEAWLLDRIEGASPDLPAPGEDTLFVIHYPQGTTLFGGEPGGPAPPVESCKSLYGYHSNVTRSDGRDVAYAVIPRCDEAFGLHGVDALTAVESHEIIEAATDPYLLTQPAFAEVGAAHVVWSRLLGGGEVADLCASLAGVVGPSPDLPFVVQRSWSNEEALAGRDPCVPRPGGEVYFNAVPAMSDLIDVSYHGLFHDPTVSARGVRIPAGTSRTIAVDLFSDGETEGPWRVSVEERWTSDRLVARLNRLEGRNGDRLELTLTVLAGGSGDEGLVFALASAQGARENLWFGVVGE